VTINDLLAFFNYVRIIALDHTSHKSIVGQLICMVCQIAKIKKNTWQKMYLFKRKVLIGGFKLMISSRS